MMKIISWNVAGLRAILKKENLNQHLKDNSYDIICIQETKAEESQVNLPEDLKQAYPYLFWNSTKGTTQRKGFSGTTIWTKIKPEECIIPEFDEEGRIIILVFEKTIIINVYVPNSQKFESDRYYFRKEWNNKFCEYLKNLKENDSYREKELIICGDFNVAHLDLDITNPKAKKNKIAGFFDFERQDFGFLLQELELFDIYRKMNPLKQKSTYWSNFLKQNRKSDNGWRLDYFIVSEGIKSQTTTKCSILMDTFGSDHCPITLEF